MDGIKLSRDQKAEIRYALWQNSDAQIGASDLFDGHGCETPEDYELHEAKVAYAESINDRTCPPAERRRYRAGGE